MADCGRETQGPVVQGLDASVVSGKPRLLHDWFAAAVPLGVSLLLLKLLLFGNQLWGTEMEGVDADILLKLPLVLGGDLLGAGLTAFLPALAVWSMGRISRRFGETLAFLLIYLLILLAALSTLSTVFAGGPLNKQALDSLMMTLAAGGETTNQGISASIQTYLSVGPLALLFILPLLSGLAFLLLRSRSEGLLGCLGKRLVWPFLLLSIVTTVVVLPFLMSGEIGGIRIYAVGLEKSPLVEFGWSYLRPTFRELTKSNIDLGDEFRLDLRANHEADGPPPLAGAAPRQTNVLVILLESAGDAYVDVEERPMPFLAEFGLRPGTVRLRHHYSTWSLTTKALFSLLCSELPYPSYKPITLVNPTIPAPSLSLILKQAGYSTAFFTSQDFAFDRQLRFLQHQGFDLLMDMHSLPGNETAWHGKWGVDDAIAVQAVLDRAKDAKYPFFILFGMVSGHHPYIASREQEEAPEGERMKEYLRAIRYADDQVRRLVEGLEQAGLLEDTLVLVVSDHGEGHGRHEGRNAYEEVIKVPAVIQGPQLMDLSLQVDLLTSHLDLAPTILGLLGLGVPCTMKGRNLVQDGEPRVAFFGGRPPKFQIGLADGPWKYLLEDGHVEKLYNRLEDPVERNNLAESMPWLIQEFKQRVLLWELHSKNLIENYGSLLESEDCP